MRRLSPQTAEEIAERLRSLLINQAVIRTYKPSRSDVIQEFPGIRICESIHLSATHLCVMEIGEKIDGWCYQIDSGAIFEFYDNQVVVSLDKGRYNWKELAIHKIQYTK